MDARVVTRGFNITADTLEGVRDLEKVHLQNLQVHMLSGPALDRAMDQEIQKALLRKGFSYVSGLHSLWIDVGSEAPSQYDNYTYFSVRGVAYRL